MVAQVIEAQTKLTNYPIRKVSSSMKALAAAA
jgi:hypothetical protein